MIHHVGLTKGGQREGVPELARVTDKALSHVPGKRCEGKEHKSRLLQQSANPVLRYVQDFLTFGLCHAGYTVRSFRCGGATHYFKVTGSMGATSDRGRGRRSCGRTGRRYLTEGLFLFVKNSTFRF